MVVRDLTAHRTCPWLDLMALPEIQTPHFDFHVGVCELKSATAAGGVRKCQATVQSFKRDDGVMIRVTRVLCFLQARFACASSHCINPSVAQIHTVPSRFVLN